MQPSSYTHQDAQNLLIQRKFREREIIKVAVIATT